MLYGPVVVDLAVHPDFLDYKSGVFSHIRPGGDHLGDQMHARDVIVGDWMVSLSVRILGWGTDQATKEDYWLVAPAMGADFGEGGFMRIKRGENQGRIEESVWSNERKQQVESFVEYLRTSPRYGTSLPDANLTEVQAAASRLRNGRAVGHDGLCTDAL